MKITPRQLRQIIREAIPASAAEEFPPASAGELSLNDPEAINISDEGVDEDGREWERRGEWPVVREPGSPPPPSRRERERARTSTRPTPTSRPIVDPRTVGAAYVSGPAPGEPFDPGRHRGEFPALPEELEPEEESEEETLGESSMTLTAVQLKRLIRKRLNEMYHGHRSNPPRGGYGPLTLPDVVKAFQDIGFQIYDGQAKQIQNQLNADGRSRRDLEQRLHRLTPYEGRSVYNAIEAVMAG